MSHQPMNPDWGELLERALRGDEPIGGSERRLEQERLRAFVDACREASGEFVASPDLAQRALHLSTREDLSWRGDLRVMRGYVRDGLRSSVVLRLAAASLLLHLAALPVVALFLLAEEPALPEFRVEVGARPAPFAESADLSEDEVVVDLTWAEGLDTLLVENTLRWSRWQITEMEDPVEGHALNPPAWLKGRAQILWGGGRTALRARDWLAPGVEPESHSLILEVESLLDLYLLERLPEGLTGEALEDMNTVAGGVATPDDPLSWLALGTLARAESYGVIPAGAAEVLRRARAEFPPKHPFRPLIEVDGDLRRRIPLDPLWMEALQRVDPGTISSDCLERLRSANILHPY